MEIIPVVLSGGSGTRLWPLSRKLYPKQLLPLVTDHTLLQDTILRVKPMPNFADEVVIVCNEEHRFLVAEQLRQIDVKSEAIILEPEGRNTAPALTLAAFASQEKGGDKIMLVMPADHVIQDVGAFSKAIQIGAELAEQDHIATFGVVPDCAETGYGYIQKGKGIGSTAAFSIRRFVEKPDANTAQSYLDSGEYLWNSGMFMLKPSVWLKHMSLLQPEILKFCEKAYKKGSRDSDFYRVDETSFLSSPSDSIDYAIMEKLTEQADGLASVISLQAEWSDVGAFAALWDIGEKDQQGNVLRGDVVAVDVNNSMLISETRLVAGVGIDNMVIVETADAVLVADKDKVQNVKQVVDWLKQQKREEHLIHRQVFRPWGSYEGIDVGERHQVKHITVNPGAALSLQLHHHRAEHWIVVSGTAKVTRGEETFIVSENESTYIPLGTKHRLENPGTIPLDMIEVQSGSYLGEDDIVRFDDQYGRAK
ncbi:Mannose-1-phosphate guanylyltransferase / Mannose-6-phosphate isomerase [hydrothermal vent metagenome]|uniref:mannose-1-phosphate guanylyltransferase n=1 Tax=hydrothermal vent metagenome TaxID=652676 RepID=A0A3B0ZBS7_9ZZZZ